MKNTLITLISTASLSSAVVLSSYEFDSSLSASSSADGISAGAASVGAGLNATFYNGGLGGDEATFGFTDGGGSLANAITNNDYISFTAGIDATRYTDPSAALAELTTLTFDFYRNSVTRSFNNIALFSSEAGFASDAASIATYTSTATVAGTESVSFDLSGHADITGTTEFRLYLWDDLGTQANSTSGTSIDNLTLNASTLTTPDVVTIPEPTSLSLLGLSALTLISRRKRA